MRTVYFISGMGADERAFQYLDLSFCNPVFIPWLKPLKGETLPSYAARMAAQIREPEPVLVGLSFGGLVAGEIAKLIPVKKLILLSSAKTASDIPFYYKLMRFVPLHQVITASLLRWANRFAYRLQRMANREDKKLFTLMLSVTDADLLKWSIHQLVHWKNNTFAGHTHQIHGTSDLMIPYLFVRPHDTVRGGTHLMLMTKAKTVSGLLKQVVESIQD